MKIFNSKRSYTLIELLMFMGLFSILLVVFTQVLTSILDVRTESESISSVEQDGNFLLNRFTYDIPRATSINQPAAVGLTSDTLNIIIDGIAYIYSLNGGNLELNVNSGVNQLNSVNTSISNLSFIRIGNDDGKDTLRISYTVTSRIERISGLESKSYQTTVGLR